MKDISTLVPDMNDVLRGMGGWDEAITRFLSEGIADLSAKRFNEKREERNYLSPSMMGKPCDRQKWYMVNTPSSGEALGAEAIGTFFYGDILEIFAIALAKAAGHTVTGLQEKLDICGIPGSGDVVIDGWVVDVKSASSYGFEKFKNNQLKGYYKTTKATGKVWVPPEEADGFGYISQLSSYLYGYRDNPEVHHKDRAAFLAVKKDRFKLHLDFYNLEEEVKNKPQEVDRNIRMVEGEMPPRGFDDTEDGKSGNRKLKFQCSYCNYKHDCWPGIRTFLYSDGPRYLTKVVRQPAETVKEVT